MEQVKAKVCVCGESSVGKTSLIRRLVTSQYCDAYQRTIGTAVSRKDIVVSTSDAREPVRLTFQIWDIMGQGEYRACLKDSFFFGCRGLLMVCDVTRPETLERLGDWSRLVDTVAGEVPTVVLANKVDLDERADGIIGRLDAFCGRLGSPYLLTSAKTGENVDAAFAHIAGRLARRVGA